MFVCDYLTLYLATTHGSIFSTFIYSWYFSATWKAVSISYNFNNLEYFYILPISVVGLYSQFIVNVINYTSMCNAKCKFNLINCLLHRACMTSSDLCSESSMCFIKKFLRRMSLEKWSFHCDLKDLVWGMSTPI